MTCGSCATRVSSALDGVQDVRIALVPGALSTIGVINSKGLTRTAVQDVVEKAGYQLATA